MNGVFEGLFPVAMLGLRRGRADLRPDGKSEGMLRIETNRLVDVGEGLVKFAVEERHQCPAPSSLRQRCCQRWSSASIQTGTQRSRRTERSRGGLVKTDLICGCDPIHCDFGIQSVLKDDSGLDDHTVVHDPVLRKLHLEIGLGHKGRA